MGAFKGRMEEEGVVFRHQSFVLSFLGDVGGKSWYILRALQGGTKYL